MTRIRKDERKALEDYRDLNISLEELRPLVIRRVSITFEPEGFYQRGIMKHTDAAVPGVEVRSSHLQNAYAKWKEQKISEKSLRDWACMMTMNDDYELAEEESEVIAEWLNTVGFDGPIQTVIKA
jgi:hypothetical protein